MKFLHSLTHLVAAGGLLLTSQTASANRLYKSNIGRTGGSRTHSGNLPMHGQGLSQKKRGLIHPKTIDGLNLGLVGPVYADLGFFRHTGLQVGTVESAEMGPHERGKTPGQYLIDPQTGSQLVGPFSPGSLKQIDKHTLLATGLDGVVHTIDLRRVRQKPLDLTPSYARKPTQRAKLASVGGDDLTRLTISEIEMRMKAIANFERKEGVDIIIPRSFPNRHFSNIKNLEELSKIFDQRNSGPVEGFKAKRSEAGAESGAKGSF